MKKPQGKQEQLLANPILTLHIETLGEAYQDAMEKKDFLTCDKIKIELTKIISSGGIEYLTVVTTKN